MLGDGACPLAFGEQQPQALGLLGEIPCGEAAPCLLLPSAKGYQMVLQVC